MSEGEGALSVEEARTRLQLAQKKVERLRQEYDAAQAADGEGLHHARRAGAHGDELEQAEEELALARRRTDVAVQMTHPREKQRAALQLAQKESQLENVARRGCRKPRRAWRTLQGLIEACSIYARRPGLVVYEEFMNASPRRKIRVGDRVTSSQGLVTIPEVNRMLVEASVGEAEVHRVAPGTEPRSSGSRRFPTLRLTGKVVARRHAGQLVDRPAVRRQALRSDRRARSGDGASCGPR